MSEQERDSAPSLPREIDITKPSISRVYDYMLGGKDNFAVDREVATMALKIAPDAPASARANRDFLRRVVRHLVLEAGITQFLDIGSGLPTQGNVHEIAQGARPGVRVVYVDNDPIVLVHGRALLAKDDTTTTVIEADLRDPESILDHPDTRRLIDRSRPVGLLLMSIIHHINDDEDPAGIIARLRDALPSGSYVALAHFHNPGPAHPRASAQAYQAEKLFNEHLGTGRWRTREQLMEFFDGWEILEPGLVPLAEWHPEPGAYVDRNILYHTLVGAVGRKP